MPLAQSWADNYQAWNLAFMSQFGCLTSLSKLLIPAVSGYHDTDAVRARVDMGEIVPSKAKEYIYLRSLALYTHLHFQIFMEENDPRWNPWDFCSGTSPWISETVTRLFGKINAKHVERYDRKVEKLGHSTSPSVYNQMWRCAQPFVSMLGALRRVVAI